MISRDSTKLCLIYIRRCIGRKSSLRSPDQKSLVSCAKVSELEDDWCVYIISVDIVSLLAGLGFNPG